VSSLNRLNIPDQGEINVGSYSYEYDGFTIEYDDEGAIESYTFNLKTPLLETMADTKAQVGESVDFKGIPYYQYQLNEFVRTFAQRFNELHNQGIDEHGSAGLDMFTAVNNVTGLDMTLKEESMEEISNTINELTVGDCISVKYYKSRRYQDFEGFFMKLDSIKRKISVYNNNGIEEISIKEISNIQKNY
jgi:hypothetical protein